MCTAKFQSNTIKLFTFSGKQVIYTPLKGATRKCNERGKKDGEPGE